MKQNEKILVYAVTGFLAVILAVAILFGKEPGRGVAPAAAGQQEVAAVTPRSLEDIMNERAGLPPVAKTPADAGAASGDAHSGADGTADPAPASHSVDSEPVDAAIDGTDNRSAASQPLVANVQLLPPTPAALVTEKLGLNREERGFRIVRARPGDTLGGLVQTWCGGLEYLEQAQALNETLTTLRVGQDVVLPWVDDEVLLAALADRQPGRSITPTGTTPIGATPPATTPAASPTAADAARPAAPVAGKRLYRVRPGDSLWKIAEREVGRRQVPKFLEQVRDLNPGLDTDRIREGQELVLPPRSATSGS